MISKGASRNALAAERPANPAPMMTTRRRRSPDGLGLTATLLCSHRASKIVAKDADTLKCRVTMISIREAYGRIRIQGRPPPRNAARSHEQRSRVHSNAHFREETDMSELRYPNEGREYREARDLWLKEEQELV